MKLKKSISYTFQYNTDFIDNLSKQKSIYNINNINELIVELYENTITSIMKFLKLFEDNSGSEILSNSTLSTSELVPSLETSINNSSKLELVTFKGLISTYNNKRKQIFEIVEYLSSINSSIQINFVIEESHDWQITYLESYRLTEQDKYYSLEKFGRFINSSKYYSNIFLNDHDAENFYLIENFLKSWCVDTIITEYNFSKTTTFANFSYLLTNCKLKNYKISEPFNLTTLNQCLKSNQFLESLNVVIDYNSVQSEENDETHQCILDNHVQNTLGDWLEFSSILSVNKTLKTLKLQNGCDVKAKDVPLSSKIQSFASIFKFNNTISSLKLKNFGEPLIQELLTQLLDSNCNSLRSLYLYSDSYILETLSDDSFNLLCSIIKSNTTLKRIKINQSSNIDNNNKLKSLCDNNSINLQLK